MSCTEKGDENVLVGRRVRTQYQGTRCFGTVQSKRRVRGKMRWTICFDDGYTADYCKCKVKKWVLPVHRKYSFKQIDYIMVSKRWASSVNSSKVRWGPSVHRNKDGRADHALVDCTWAWRVKQLKEEPTIDYSTLIVNNVPELTPIAQKFADTFTEAFAAASEDTNPEEVSTAKMCKNWAMAIKTAAKSLPLKQPASMCERYVSKRTNGLYERKAKMSRKLNTKAEFESVQKSIKDSALQDYRDWVSENVQQMETANSIGNVRKIYAILQKMSNKPKDPPENLNTDADGNMLKSAEEIAKTWEKFLKKKFAATPAEIARPAMPPIPPERLPTDNLTRDEFEKSVNRMPNGKAVGPDGVPAEAFKYCVVARNALFQIINRIWNEEKLPSDFASAKFVMLYKGKGSSNNPAKYRCIGLLGHAYKVLSQIILQRLLEFSEKFLADWQAGFRQLRGCRDNSMILRTLCQRTLRHGKKLALTFIDYTAAFDSVSHKFVDSTLEKCKVTNKLRAIFRAVYLSASAFTTVKAPDNKTVKSGSFDIRRGVVQGDITSPLYFILALEAILRIHDERSDKGVTLAETIIHTLGYADDAALVDAGDEEGILRASERVSAIAEGSRTDADMVISIPKTKVLHVRAQDAVSRTTNREAEAACKYTCPHVNCGYKFKTKHGMRVHAGKCKHKNVFVVERLLGHEGNDLFARRYLVRWEGHGPKEDRWEPRSHLPPDVIQDYEVAKGVYDYDWPHRCQVCDHPCRSEHGIKIHHAKCHKEYSHIPAGFKNKYVRPLQDFTNRLADKAVQVEKLAKQQENRPVIRCEGEELENKFKFKYLGTLFAADGVQDYDIAARINKAKVRCGQLSHIFDSDKLSLELKIRLYVAAVCSLLTYGSETWLLTDRVRRKINNANSIMLARISGRSYREEARPSTTSFNLVLSIRRRRLRWVGHILRDEGRRLLGQREGERRLVCHALAEQREAAEYGDLWMDTPPHSSLEQAAELALDKAAWEETVKALY